MLVGKFISPQALSDLLFDHLPQTEHIVFEIEIIEINKQTTRIQARVDRYEYDRNNQNKTQYNIILEEPPKIIPHKDNLKSILDLIQNQN